MKADHIGLEIAEVLARKHLGLDFVWLLRMMPALAPGKERANVDIFRVQDGKVAEHWDYQQTSPADTSRRKTTSAGLTTADRTLGLARHRR